MKSVSVALAALGLLAVCAPAQAAYVIHLTPRGADQIFGTGSGSIDLTDLTFVSAGGLIDGGIGQGAAFVGSGEPVRYGGNSGPAFAPGGGGLRTTPFRSGAIAGLFTNDIVVPQGYVSGTALGTSTALWGNPTVPVTYASEHITPGTYVWTWGSGAHADSLTIIAAVPEPGTWAMLILGAGMIGAAARRRRHAGALA